MPFKIDILLVVTTILSISSGSLLIAYAAETEDQSHSTTSNFQNRNDHTKPSSTSDTSEMQSGNGQPSPASGITVSDPLTGGSLTGVGMTLGKQGKKIVVMQFITGGVAEAAGIQKGDEIISVDGRSIGSNPTINGVVKLIRGPVDSKVSILVQRGTTRQSFTMTRVLFRTPIDGFCPAR
ncbi:MAG: PDZ domain-containing protein [Candidatus Obscuribacterales bacterium]|nr:PDZ domain-containing protein [Candidatus Obscuribacterales bacterium]